VAMSYTGEQAERHRDRRGAHPACAFVMAVATVIGAVLADDRVWVAGAANTQTRALHPLRVMSIPTVG
jgi:hypothetical protein